MSEGAIPTLQAAIIGLVVAGAAIAFALGALSKEEAQIVVSSAGTIIAAVFVIANELRHRTNQLARMAKAQEAILAQQRAAASLPV